MTDIEWVLNPDNKTRGITVNSKTGCLNHTNGLCKGGGFPCYAYRLAHGRLRTRYLANTNIAPPKVTYFSHYNNPFYPRWWPERLEQIRKIKKPTGIFLDDMSDWIGDYWPEEWTEMELQVMRDCPQHRFYTLTKQPQNLIKFSPFPGNCWVGVTAPSMSLQGDIDYIFQNISAKVKFVSFEPLLDYSPIDFRYVDWAIIGACTGRSPELLKLQQQYPSLTPLPYGHQWTLQPPIGNVEEIVQACDKAKIPVFLKDNLKQLIRDNRWPKWSMDNRSDLRQELPECR